MFAAMFDSLHRRPRGHELAALLSVISRGRVPSPLSPHALELRLAELESEAREQDRRAAELDDRDEANVVVHEQLRMKEQLAQTALDFSIERHDAPDWPARLGLASRTLLAQLGDDGRAAVLDALPPAERDLIESSPPVVGARRLLGYGATRAIAVVLERTRLLPIEPPEHVHSMCRGPDCVAGSLENADLVLEVLEQTGWTPTTGQRILDFGCSSGRITRVLAAALPEITWLGCDPNNPAIEWAAANLSTADFFANSNDPPLPLQAGSLDAVYAISIWSHFDADAALEWLTEMHRVLRPGGRLVLTAAGLANVAVLTGSTFKASPEFARAAWAGLSTDGFFWADSFGRSGDWGVAHPSWGAAYFTPEWLLSRILSDWSLRLYQPARLLGVQDVYVLERCAEPTPGD
jgi:SAM-dependent methyltransferase